MRRGQVSPASPTAVYFAPHQGADAAHDDLARIEADAHFDVGQPRRAGLLWFTTLMASCMADRGTPPPPRNASVGPSDPAAAEERQHGRRR